MTTSTGERLRWHPGTNLAGVDPASTPGVDGRDEAEADIEERRARLDEWQERLWAEHERGLLLVLQGMDTSGKSGTVTHVIAGMNPLGVDVAAFKAPTDEERAHPFLWRIERRLPGPGEVVVFDRSHYEDVLIVRVRELVGPDEWRGRYDQINAWEADVVGRGIAIVKVMLHISFDEQRERLLARLDDRDKHWKFHESDVDERARWLEYQAAYQDVLDRCSTDAAPWYVVPADRKWYRNWAVARILDETFEELDPRYPRPDLDVDGLRERLRPPN
jgi:PPK2 family polyphosphate:nucleotide phosphotransferase